MIPAGTGSVQQQAARCRRKRSAGKNCRRRKCAGFVNNLGEARLPFFVLTRCCRVPTAVKRHLRLNERRDPILPEELPCSSRGILKEAPDVCL